MQGVAFFLISFFIACWIIVIGYHAGFTGFPARSHLDSFTKGTLPLAYTGAALSVCTLVLTIVAGTLNK